MANEQAHQHRPEPAQHHAAPEARAAEAPAALGALTVQLNRSPSRQALSAASDTLASRAAPVQRAAVVQRATTHQQQREIYDKATDVVKWTTQQAIANLNKRLTFNANPGGDAGHIANFGNYRTNAETTLSNHANAFAFVVAQGFTNYHGNGLDNSTIPAEYAIIKGVRDRNTATHVEDRKKAMIAGVAKQALRDDAMGYNSNALRDADTLNAAQAALDAWETRYFTVSRSQIIEAAKKRGKNGEQGRATVWEGLTSKIGNHTTHMTVYNAQISQFNDYLVRANTDEAASNTLANYVLANGQNALGIHVTAETGDTPKIFGNPPDANRHVGTLPNDVNSWDKFKAPLKKGQDEVRDDVWKFVNGKVGKRP